MKNCSRCNSFHEEWGNYCTVCKTGNYSLAYENMQRGKELHPCASCSRLTSTSEGNVCKICKNYTRNMTDQERFDFFDFYERRKRDQLLVHLYEKEENEKLEKAKKSKEEKLKNPKPVDWVLLFAKGATATLATALVTFLYYNFSGIFVEPLYYFVLVLLSSELPYFLRIPLSIPILFLIYGIIQHIYYKFYYSGFFTPIKSKLNDFNIKLSNLKLEWKIWYNSTRSRRRNTQAYKKERDEKYENIQESVKNDGEYYDTIKEFIRYSREQPALESTNLESEN